MKSKTILFVIIVLLAAANNSSAGISADAGTIKGRVKATAGGQSALIAGAKLTLTNKATPAQPLRTVSNEAGELVHTGQTTLVFQRTDTGRLCAAPAALLNHLKPFFEPEVDTK